MYYSLLFARPSSFLIIIGSLELRLFGRLGGKDGNREFGDLFVFILMFSSRLVNYLPYLPTYLWYCLIGSHWFGRMSAAVVTKG
jgi:hypothetical protein